AVVVFQPELRNALARLGQSRLMRRFSQGDRQSVAEEIAEAMDRLARGGTGAIIAVEGDIGLEEVISSGVPMEAKGPADPPTSRRNRCGISCPERSRIWRAASASPRRPNPTPRRRFPAPPIVSAGVRR